MFNYDPKKNELKKRGIKYHAFFFDVILNLLETFSRKNQLMPKVSIIIPCYNHGDYLNDAVESALDQTLQDFEVIIVNDGSTDASTIKQINAYDNPLIKVINIDNSGVSTARNTGIEKARSPYILPLDADDKIGNNYCKYAVDILDKNSSVGIVYCQAGNFGKKDGKWDLPKFSIQRMLSANIIFSAGFFRKSDWEKVGGYNSNMVHGLEDYDFWLSILGLGREVYQIPEIMFYYRMHKVKSHSRSKRMDNYQRIEAQQQIFQNQKELYTHHVDVLFEMISNLQKENLQLNEKKLSKRFQSIFKKS